MSEDGFRQRLENLINSESRENGSNTPDFILADYLVGCLKNFDDTVCRREKWYGRGCGMLKNISGSVVSGPDDPDTTPKDEGSR